MASACLLNCQQPINKLAEEVSELDAI